MKMLDPLIHEAVSAIEKSAGHPYSLPLEDRVLLIKQLIRE
jgi:hypothetical protein